MIPHVGVSKSVERARPNIFQRRTHLWVTWVVVSNERFVSFFEPPFSQPAATVSSAQYVAASRSDDCCDEQ